MGADNSGACVDGDPRRPVRGLIVLAALAVALVGCSAPVTGAPEPGPHPASTTTVAPPPPTTPTTAVSAACPLLSAGDVGRIYNLDVAAQEGTPLVQAPATTYSCSYVNGAKQKLAALQVIVDPTAAGNPRHYLDSYVDEFLAAGAAAQPVEGLGAAADSYVKSDQAGNPVAFVVATVQPVGSTLDLAQFIVSSSNAGDAGALKQMVGVLRIALGRL